MTLTICGEKSSYKTKVTFQVVEGDSPAFQKAYLEEDGCTLDRIFLCLHLSFPSKTLGFKA